jgi:hypothetical protein
MKTQRALILPVLLATLVVNQLEVRAQPNLTPPRTTGGGVSSTLHDSVPGGAGVQTAGGAAPLGVPSSLGAAPTGTMMGFGKPGGPGKYATRSASYQGTPGVAPAMMMDPSGGYMPGGMIAGPAPMPGPMGPMPAGLEGEYYPDGAMGMGHPDDMMMGHGMYGHDPFGERGFDLIRYLLPYGEGGWSAARWFDIQVEYMQLTRDKTSPRTVNFTSDGPAGLGEPLIVLSTDDLNMTDAPGFRAAAAWQLGASSNIEFNYFGTFHWSASASVTSPENELYSVLSDFGNNPPPQSDPIIVRGGFTDTDSAHFAGLDYTSQLNSYELDYRRRWIFPNGKLQGSWLVGVRHVHLEEGLLHQTKVGYAIPDQDSVFGFMDYRVTTDNALTGFQLGGDLWATIIPGLQIGTEGKAGIYGNRVKQTTTVDALSMPDGFYERVKDSRASFVGEAGFMGTWRLNQHLSLRGGYQMVYVDGVALAPDNFNAEPPLLQGGREPLLHDKGFVFYHGFTGGVEWMW